MKRLFSVLLTTAIALPLLVYAPGVVRATIEDWSTTAASNNASPPDGAPENMAPSAVNDTMREMMAQVRRFAERLASATHGVEAGSADAYTVTPPISASSYASGQVFTFIPSNANTGASTLTISALASKSIVKVSDTALASGDLITGRVYMVVYDGTNFQLINRLRGPASSTDGNCVSFSGASGSILQDSGQSCGSGLTQGRQTVWIPATAMFTRTSTGPVLTTQELTTAQVMLRTLDYDGATDEFAQFQIGMPKSWDEGSVAAEIKWTAQSGSGTVQWYMQCVAVGDNDALDASFGTAVGVTDTLITAWDHHVTSEITPVTVGGTPAEGDMVICQIYRDADVDSHAADAELIGVRFIYSVDAANDN